MEFSDGVEDRVDFMRQERQDEPGRLSEGRWRVDRGIAFHVSAHGVTRTLFPFQLGQSPVAFPSVVDGVTPVTLF